MRTFAYVSAVITAAAVAHPALGDLLAPGTRSGSVSATAEGYNTGPSASPVATSTGVVPSTGGGNVSTATVYANPFYAGTGSPPAGSQGQYGTASSTVNLGQVSGSAYSLNAAANFAFFLVGSNSGQVALMPSYAFDQQLVATQPEFFSLTMTASNPSAGTGPALTGNAVEVNQPQLWWTSNSLADYQTAPYSAPSSTDYPGETVSLYGTNLSQNDGSQSTNTSWVYLQSVSDPSVVYVVQAKSSTEQTDTEGTDVNPYKVDFTIPASIQPGPDGRYSFVNQYNVFIYNGHGAEYGLSNSIQIHVGDVPTDQTIRLADELAHYNQAHGTTFSQYLDPADTLINPEAVQDAINALSQAQTPPTRWLLQLPTGTLAVSNSPLFLRSNVVLVGAGSGTDPRSSTIVEAAANSRLDAVLQLQSTENVSNAGLISLAIFANNGLRADDAGSSDVPAVIQFNGTVSDILIENVYANGANSLSHQGFVYDIYSTQATEFSQIRDSKFIGQGIDLNDVGWDTLDNCQIIAAGYIPDADIFASGGHVSITHCTATDLYDDITGPGQNLDFGQTPRLSDLIGTGGQDYVGDNDVVDALPSDRLASGTDGGEMVLFEGNSPLNVTPLDQAPILASDQKASDVGISGFTQDGFVSTTYFFSQLPYRVSIGVTYGPGTGETRFVDGCTSSFDPDTNVTTYTYSLDRPWSGVPSANSTIWLGGQTGDIAVYQNVLQGDGAGSFLQSATTGVEVDGYNIVVDDNEISNLSNGISVFNGGPADPNDGISTSYNYNAFNIYSNNSFHNVGTGLGVNVAWNYLPGATGDSSWFLGNVFRDNIISGAGSAVTFLVNDGNGTVADYSQILMNVLDGNTCTGIRYGVYLKCTTTPSDNYATTKPGGVLDTVLVDNFFASDGVRNTALGVFDSQEIALINDNGQYDTDPTPFVDVSENAWQGFDQQLGEH